MQAAPKDSTFGPQQLDGASDADDGAAVVHVDGGDSRNFWKPGYKHNVAGDRHDESTSGRKRGVSDGERPLRRKRLTVHSEKLKGMEQGHHGVSAGWSERVG